MNKDVSKEELKWEIQAPKFFNVQLNELNKLVSQQEGKIFKLPCKAFDGYFQFYGVRDENIHYELTGKTQVQVRLDVESPTKKIKDNLFKFLDSKDVRFIKSTTGKNAYSQNVYAEFKFEEENYQEIMNSLNELYEKTHESLENFFGENGNIMNSNLIAEKLENSKNLILTGAPGTGKTYSVRKYVAEKLGFNKNQSLDVFLNGHLFDPNDDSKKDKRYCFVQFHAGYDYTDFVEGFKPVTKDKDGHKLDKMKFVRKDGIFKAFCDEASKNLNEDYYFVIDEINRADLSRVFGELFFGLEDNYRGVHFKTQYGSDMVIPPNVKLIGTMNDVDRGVESIDFALRRRFTWHEVDAESSEVIIDENITDEEKRKVLKTKMRALNEKICELLGKEYQIGGAYFVKEKGDVDAIWDNHLSSLINEYLRGNKKKEEIIEKLEDAYKKKNKESLS